MSSSRPRTETPRTATKSARSFPALNGGACRAPGQRGEAENRIKETQLDLFGARASSQKFLANGQRILFSALAYTLMQRLREMGLAGTELAAATAATIRVKLLKIGAVVVRNTRRIRILFASHHPQHHVFLTAARALASP